MLRTLHVRWSMFAVVDCLSLLYQLNRLTFKVIKDLCPAVNPATSTYPLRRFTGKPYGLSPRVEAKSFPQRHAIPLMTTHDRSWVAVQHSTNATCIIHTRIHIEYSAIKSPSHETTITRNTATNGTNNNTSRRRYQYKSNSIYSPS